VAIGSRPEDQITKLTVRFAKRSALRTGYFNKLLENPEHFAKSREVGPYLGLVPKQEDSGESQPQLGISKTGDTMLRKLLVGSAQYILGPFGPDSDLRSYGQRLCERGGKNAKKRAAVAVARKLAVLLHRLWVSGEVYEPLGYASSRGIVQPAAA
jgi:hypothetical protein